MKYLKRLFENYNFDDVSKLDISDAEIKDLISTRFLNPEFIYVYGETNYPEIDVEDTQINRENNSEVPYLTIDVSIESLFEFEKSPEGLNKLKTHLLGKKTLEPVKGREDDRSKNRIFPSLTIDILVTIHNNKLFCRIGGDFSIYIGDFPLINHNVEKTRFVETKSDVKNLLIDILNNLNIYTIEEIQELNK